MKTTLACLCLAALSGGARAADPVDLVRQTTGAGKVVWDMPAVGGRLPEVMFPGKQSTLSQYWSIDGSTGGEHLLDEKLAGAYIPSATLRVTTLDPDGRTPRTRVDQPFTVDLHISGLLAGPGFPRSASSVLLERRLGGESHARGYVSDNGRTSLRFEASSLTAKDPTKARGVERFVVHALSGGGDTAGPLASATLEVLPVASGSIRGIRHGATLRGRVPTLTLDLRDLYPKSDTRLLLFKGTQIQGVEGTPLKSVVIDLETCAHRKLTLHDLGSQLSAGGTYTLALVSDTVYGRELLCDPLTFHLIRPSVPGELPAALTRR